MDTSVKDFQPDRKTNERPGHSNTLGILIRKLYVD